MMGDFNDILKSFNTDIGNRSLEHDLVSNEDDSVASVHEVYQRDSFERKFQQTLGDIDRLVETCTTSKTVSREAPQGITSLQASVSSWEGALESDHAINDDVLGQCGFSSPSSQWADVPQYTGAMDQLSVPAVFKTAREGGISYCNTAATTTASPFREHDSSLARRVQKLDDGEELPIAVLRRNYSSLLEVVREERFQHDNEKKRAEALEDDLREQATAHELALDDFRLETIRLHSQLRKLASDRMMHETFELYEESLQRSNKECQRLRERNVVLEMQVHDLLADRTSSNHKGTAPAEVLLKTSLRRLQKENEALSTELQALQKRERKFHVHARVASDAMRRGHQLAAQLQDTHQTLNKEQLECARAHAELERVCAELSRLQMQEAALRTEREKVLQELFVLRERIQELQEEKRRSDQLHRFVHKHSRADVDVEVPRVRRAVSQVQTKQLNSNSQGQNKLPQAAKQWAIPPDVSLQMVSPHVSDALRALHDNIATSAPSLLPIVGKLRRALLDNLHMEPKSTHTSMRQNELLESISDWPIDSRLGKKVGTARKSPGIGRRNMIEHIDRPQRKQRPSSARS
jgi:hypothetical protein